MTPNQIITSAVDALTGKPLFKFTLQTKVLPKYDFIDWWLRKPRPQAQREFEIHPCVVGNQYRIAAKALTLPQELFEEASDALSMVPEHLPTMVYIIASAITNSHLEPPASLIQYLERNMDNLDILEALGASLQATNMQSFSTSIVLMRGMKKIL